MSDGYDCDAGGVSNRKKILHISDKSNIVFLQYSVKSVDLRNIDYLSQMRQEKFTTVKHTLLSIYR